MRSKFARVGKQFKSLWFVVSGNRELATLYKVTKLFDGQITARSSMSDVLYLTSNSLRRKSQDTVGY